MIDLKDLKKMRKSNAAKKATLAVKVDRELFDTFNNKKKEHKAAGLDAFDMEQIIEAILTTLIDAMDQELQKK